MMRLSLVVLKTRKEAELLAFYQALGIDFAPERHGSGPAHYAGRVGETIVEIYPLEGDATEAASVRLGFVVDDVARCVRVLAPGARPRASPWGLRVVLRDPDGRAVELIQEIDGDAPTPPIPMSDGPSSARPGLAERQPVDIIHSDQPLHILPPSLFLAGPSPRSPEVRSWRPRAVEILHALGFQGTVLVPERKDETARFDYLDQVEWEFAALEACSVIVFWVPRDLATLPGFTTNIEFGRYVGSGRAVYGRPEAAPQTRYLDWLYRKLTGRPPEATLEGTLRAALASLPGTSSR